MIRQLLFIGINVLFIQCVVRGQVHIIVNAPYMDNRDTLELRLWDDYVGFPYINDHRLLKAENKDNRYIFSIDSVGVPLWISLHAQYQRVKGNPHTGLIKNSMVMDKDSLLITFIPKETDMQLSQSYYDNGGPIVTDNWAFRVNGRGREKFHLHGYLDSLSREAGKQVRGRMASVTVLDGAEAYQDMVNLVASLGTNYEGVEKLLILNAWGGLLTQVILDIRGQFRNVALPVEKKAKYTDWYMAELAFREENYSKNILDIMSRSPEMIEYLYHHYLWLHTQVEGGRYEVLPIYDRIKEMIGHSDLREKVLTRFLMAYFGDDPSEAILRDSRSFFRNPLCIDWLNRFEAKLSGQDIKLTLPDMSGRKYSAEEFRGKVVLIDFWYMACIPCRNYMKTVISPLSKYFDREAGFQIITVSTDDKATFSKVLKTNDFLPSDALHLYTEDKRFRHPVLNRLGVNSYPYPILLNKEGKILATGSKLKDLETVKKIITKELER